MIKNEKNKIKKEKKKIIKGIVDSFSYLNHGQYYVIWGQSVGDFHFHFGSLLVAPQSSWLLAPQISKHL